MRNIRGIVIVIPCDPRQKVQVIENGFTVVNRADVISSILREYCERGVTARLEEMLRQQGVADD